MKNLDKLEWPKNRLDIIFLCEEDDLATHRAIEKFANPSNSRLIILASSYPRTKPRALNIGLSHALGEYVCVYDAEDCPHSQQLIAAFGQFKIGGENLGVIQSPLVAINHSQSYISGAFALDYAVWFRVVLPFLIGFSNFIPLGGTSNHFRKSALLEIGGWDPFNLTEDADIGVKLRRKNFHAQLIDIPTFELAPPNVSQWLRQRTRWIEGHLQTIGVHFKSPLILYKEVGFLGFMGILTGLWSGPIFIGQRIVILLVGAAKLSNQSILIHIVWAIIAIGLEILLHFVGAMRDGRRVLLWQILFLPIYWLLQSIAYIRASIKIFIAPYVWEKTHHEENAGAYLEYRTLSRE